MGADSHSHSHAHQVTGAGRDARRSLVFALALNAGYTAVEVVAGLASGSLALLADAGHNLSDVIALTVALAAAVLASRPATPARSFGLRRGEVLAALANASTLVVLSVLILIGAAVRFADPVDVPGGLLILVAAVGIVVNVAGAAAVYRRGGRDLNLRASFLHLAGDAAASLGVIVAGIIILATGWSYADPLVSILIALLILATAWEVIRDSVLVLLEAAPKGLDVDGLGRRMAAEPGVAEVHDLHVWAITPEFPALSAHVLVRPEADCHEVRRRLGAMLEESFGIGHSTLQVDHARPRIIVRGARSDPR